MARLNKRAAIVRNASNITTATLTNECLHLRLYIQPILQDELVHQEKRTFGFYADFLNFLDFNSVIQTEGFSAGFGLYNTHTHTHTHTYIASFRHPLLL